MTAYSSQALLPAELWDDNAESVGKMLSNAVDGVQEVFFTIEYYDELYLDMTTEPFYDMIVVAGWGEA